MSIDVQNIRMSNLKIYLWSLIQITFEQFAYEQCLNIHMSSIVSVLAHEHY